MPAERCYVGVVLNGCEQFYQREMERKGRDGKWEAVPFFVLNRSEAITMTEAVATTFVLRLRSLGAHPWVEDARDGRRIEVASESIQPGEDNRTAVCATLDDENLSDARWYVVKPICRPEGRKWFLRIDIPGIPEPQIIYAEDPLAVLRRAEDMGFLKYAQKYERPQPQQAALKNKNGWRRRPGDIR
jgi:hypothetical protein